MAGNLTGKQRVFIDAYLSNGFNATEAARTAGYKGSNTALGVQGYENLRNPKIASVVNERMNECTASANEVLATLTNQMRGSISKVIRVVGDMEIADKLEESGADKLVKKFKIRRTIRRKGEDEELEDITHEFEIHDPQSAAVHVGKFHKLFTEKHEHAGKDGGPIELNVVYDK